MKLLKPRGAGGMPVIESLGCFSTQVGLQSFGSQAGVASVEKSAILCTDHSVPSVPPSTTSFVRSSLSIEAAVHPLRRAGFRDSGLVLGCRV